MSAVTAAEARRLPDDPLMSPAAGASPALRGREVTILPATLLADIEAKIKNLLTDFEAAKKSRSCWRIAAIVLAVTLLIFTVVTAVFQLPVGIGVGIVGMAFAGCLYYKNCEPYHKITPNAPPFSLFKLYFGPNGRLGAATEALTTLALDLQSIYEDQPMPASCTTCCYHPSHIVPELLGWEALKSCLQAPVKRSGFEEFLRKRNIREPAQLETDKVLQVWRKYQLYSHLEECDEQLKEYEAKSKQQQPPLLIDRVIPPAAAARMAARTKEWAETSDRDRGVHKARIAARLAAFNNEFEAEFRDYL